MTDLITAVENALSGSLTLDGEAMPVYVRGHSEDQSPCVIIERPDVDGNEYLDRSSTSDARLRLRVHDRKGSGGFYALRAAEIADSVHSVLSPSLTVDGSTVAFTEPDKRPVSDYEIEGQPAYDIVLIYDLFLP